MSYLSKSKIKTLKFRSCGKNVLISEKASIYNADRISIGNNVRIDDFCILSAGLGGILVGNYVHIACYSSLVGSGEIQLHDYANISARVSIYSSSDDYSGNFMTSPMIPAHFKNVDNRALVIGRHVILGCGSVILPGVHIGEGCAVGALSLVKADCDPFSIYSGIPVRRRAERYRGLLEEEKRFLEGISHD